MNDYFDTWEAEQGCADMVDAYLQDELEMMAPEHCRGCEDLLNRTEDNRFNTDSRYPGDKATYGNEDCVPICRELKDYCPDGFTDCPHLIGLPDMCTDCPALTDCHEHGKVDFKEIQKCKHELNAKEAVFPKKNDPLKKAV